MRKFKQINGKVNIKHTNQDVDGVLTDDGVEMNNPFISDGDLSYNSNTNTWTIEIRYYTNKNTKESQSRNIFKTGLGNHITQADIDNALDRYEPKSKGKNWE